MAVRIKQKILEMLCPKCGKLFYRTAREFPVRCPSCQTLLKLPSKREVAKVKQKKYGFNTAVIKKVAEFPWKHPKASKLAGAAGLGAIVGHKIAQPKRRPDPSSYYGFLSGAGKAVGHSIKGGAVRARDITVAVTMLSLADWIGRSILAELEKKRVPVIGPYMPEVRADIELSPSYCIDQVAHYIKDIPTLKLYALEGKALEAVKKLRAMPHSLKVGAEKGMLAWLMGFITAELIGRGIGTPKRKVTVDGGVPIRSYTLEAAERIAVHYTKKIDVAGIAVRKAKREAREALEAAARKTPEAVTKRAIARHAKKKPSLVAHSRGVAKAVRREAVRGSTAANPGRFTSSVADWAKSNKAFDAATARIIKANKLHSPKNSVGVALRRLRAHSGKVALVGGAVSGATLGAIGSAALGTHLWRKRQQKQKQTQAYGFKSAAGKIWKGTKAVGHGAGAVTNVGLTTWMASDLLKAAFPKKKRPVSMAARGNTLGAPRQQGLQSYQDYALFDKAVRAGRKVAGIIPKGTPNQWQQVSTAAQIARPGSRINHAAKIAAHKEVMLRAATASRKVSKTAAAAKAVEEAKKISQGGKVKGSALGEGWASATGWLKMLAQNESRKRPVHAKALREISGKIQRERILGGAAIGTGSYLVGREGVKRKVRKAIGDN